MLQKHQDVFGPNSNVFTLIRNFNSLKINTDKIDFVGCFLPWDADVEAGPNARHFLREPSEHTDICHLYTRDVSSTVANKQKSKTKLIGPSSSKKQPTLSLNVDKSSKQCTLQNSLRASQKSFQQRKIDDYNTKIKLIGGCKSNLESLQEYHKFSEELIGNMIPPPLEVALSKNNINRTQVAILDWYRYENSNSIYQELRKSPFWSLHHDSISKFNKEYNGIMVRGIDSSLNPLNVPYAL